MDQDASFDLASTLTSLARRSLAQPGYQVQAYMRLHAFTPTCEIY